MKFELTTRIDEAGNDVPAFGYWHDDEMHTSRLPVLDPSEARALAIANKALSDDFYKDQIR